MAWTTIETLPEGWKLRYWDGGMGTDEGVYLETPSPDAVRLAINYDNGERNRVREKVTFSGVTEVPAAVKNAVLRHFSYGWIVVAKFTVGRWEVTHAVRRGIRRIYVDALHRCLSDFPIQYGDGRIAYDFPERIPAYVKKAVTKAFTLALSDVADKPLAEAI